MQDLGSASGPSHSLKSGGIGLGDWHQVGGGEAGYAFADPSDPNIVYAGEYGGIMTRYDHRTGQARNITVNQFNPSGIDPAKMKYRFQWTAPILDLAARPEDRLPRRQRAVPHPRRRADVGERSRRT